MALYFDKKKNFEERLQFLHLHIGWVKKTPNKIWSKQQADFLDSLYENGRNYSLSSTQYLEMIRVGRMIREQRLQKREKKPRV